MQSVQGFFEQVLKYALDMQSLEIIGLVAGLAAVWWLLRENILTWPAGLLYTVVSVVIFWESGLLQDFVLHIYYFGMNAYGWYWWLQGKKNERANATAKLPITTSSNGLMLRLALLSVVGIVASGYLFSHHPNASVPYWDATTSILSVVGMWLTARKKIENWYYWFVVDVLCTGIYFYKGLYFYSLLYAVYIFLAVAGYLAWRSSMQQQQQPVQA